MSHEWSHGLCSCFEDITTCKILPVEISLFHCSIKVAYICVFPFSRRHPIVVLSMVRGW